MKIILAYGDKCICYITKDPLDYGKEVEVSEATIARWLRVKKAFDGCQEEMWELFGEKQT